MLSMHEAPQLRQGICPPARQGWCHPPGLPEIPEPVGDPSGHTARSSSANTWVQAACLPAHSHQMPPQSHLLQHGGQAR